MQGGCDQRESKARSGLNGESGSETELEWNKVSSRLMWMKVKFVKMFVCIYMVLVKGMKQKRSFEMIWMNLQSFGANVNII